MVTASERSARALTANFHRARRAEGAAAWPTPAIQPWNEFVSEAWRQHAADARLILNSVQEETLWAEAIAAHPQGAGLIDGPRHRMARMAMEAHALLCAYSPQLLDPRMRTGWQLDAGAFSRWLASFDEACRAGNLVSAARLPLETIPLLEFTSAMDGRAGRAPLLLAGFDRIQPTQRQFFDAWGAWSEAAPGEGAPERAKFYEAADLQAEIAACAIWCGRQLDANPRARILVVSQEAAARRGEMERAFLRHTGAESLFEFTLGVPIDRVPAAHSAHLILRWLASPLAENEVDWLFASGYAAEPRESRALQHAMRQLRSRGSERPDWPLESLTAEIRREQSRSASTAVRWLDRMMQACRRTADFSHQRSTRAGAAQEQLHMPLECAEFASQLLEFIGWPARRALLSAEFQAARRFHQAMETAGSLGFNGRRISWQEFLSSLARILNEILFAPESRDAPIQIAGPAESAGLTADAIWFLGATENAWPAAVSGHPLIPIQLQRQFGMPHAAPQLDWELARATTARLLASAPEVCFSFARQADDAESRASRLVLPFAGEPQPMPENLAAPDFPAPVTSEIIDASHVAYSPGKVEGGSEVLTFQSQCAFKAFAAVRLGAQKWDPAQACLTPTQRGGLLHSALHAIWAGPPDGLHNLHDLHQIQDRKSFVAGHVRRVFEREINDRIRARMKGAYLELEERRMVRLICEWLEYESARAPFEAMKTEDKRTIHLAGLTLELRLDRIDRLNDGSLLVIDYKTGNVTPESWDLPRPDDVQLPLYAGFALDAGPEPPNKALSGLVFARLRPGKFSFAGRVRDARTVLLPALGARNPLVKKPFDEGMLTEWRERIEQLARDFLAGRADVDPRQYPKTCERCGLQTLCRIGEHPPRYEDFEEDADPEFEQAADE